MFILFVNDLDEVVADIPRIFMTAYANDTDYLAAAETFPEVQKLDLVLQRSKDWFLSNGLCMNTSKTKATLFKTTHAGFDTPEHLSMETCSLNLEQWIIMSRSETKQKRITDATKLRSHKM
ncbi:hypothetical protein HHI36_013460 [Cryptolaemus montrouzieri]|uniref:Reverse transcriptase domain-containing protein n=1 Tax=Cryptolaemus montrouzieri TaxID=559131 RepID=A0ABD2NHB6_9CUCU